MSRFSRRHVLGAAGVLSGLALAACGGETAGPGASTGTGGAGAPTGSSGASGKTPINVGVTSSLSGTTAKGPQSHKAGYELWAEQASQRGLLGRPVKLTVLDDANDPSGAGKLYEKLLAEDKVDLILGPYGSSVTRAASTATEKLRVPMLVTGTSDSDLWKRSYKYLFGLYAVAETWFHGVLDMAQKQGLRKLAIVNENTTVPNAIAAGTAAYARSVGMQVVFQDRYPLRATDLAPLLGRLKAAAPEVVLAGAYAPEALLLTRQMKEQDVNAQLLAFSMGANEPEFLSGLGSAAEYVLVCSLWEADLKTPGNKEFQDAYKKKTGSDPDASAAAAYAGGQVLEAAVKKAGSLDHEKVREALASVEVATILPGRYKVEPDGVQNGIAPVVVQWQGGQKVVVAPDALATGKPKLPAPDWKAR